MTEEKTFEPITTQEEFDQRIKARLAREREKWEKESGSADLKAELQSKDEEISEIRREHYRAEARRAIVDELGAHGVTEQGRIERILRHVDLGEIEPSEDGNPYFGSVRRQLASISKDMPELLKYELGAGSGIGSKTPVLTGEKPLTREEVEGMSESEINSRWDQIKAFMAGQRWNPQSLRDGVEKHILRPVYLLIRRYRIGGKGHDLDPSGHSRYGL